jgi:cytochrome c oxidase subunit IV
MIVPKKTYILVWAALLVLLFATWGFAMFDLRPFNAAVAMTIALVKMLLIILFFMHVRYSSRLTWLFAAAGFVWLAIMILLTLNDYLTRGAG